MLAWPSLSRLIIFIVFVAFWVAGQGMHLAVNSIDNLLGQRGLETGDIYSRECWVTIRHFAKWVPLVYNIYAGFSSGYYILKSPHIYLGVG
jgi:hypothetical protein